jgi:HSP90 family molecular chaperone
MMRLDYNTNLKLYVKRVFITDDFKDLIPSYLNFLKGVIDSDDLELNVSREMLQHSKTLEAIKKKLLRKIIALFQDMATEKPDKFEEFYKKYSTSLKLGVIQDTQNRDRLSKILRFNTAKSASGTLVSLEDYVTAMKKDQNVIYYLGGENVDVIRRSPLIERLVKRGYDVLLLSEPIDEYAVSALDRYDRKYKFTDVSKAGLNLKEDEEEQKKLEESYKPLTEYITNVLSDKISKATVSIRLAKTPAAIVAAEYGYSPNMERVMKAQALRDERYFRSDQKHVMEINARHPLIKKLLAIVEADGETDETANNVKTLHDIAVLNSGFNLKDTTLLYERVNRMMALSLNIDPDEPVEEEIIEEAPAADASTEKAEEKKEDL